MKTRLSDQGYHKAVVTGSSSGLGRAMVDALTAEGLAVTGLSRRAPETAPENYTHLPLDLLDSAKLEATLEVLRGDPPDIWINNAGRGWVGSAWDASDDAIRSSQRLLYEIPVQLSRFFAHVCQREQKRAAYLIQVSSLAVELPIPSMPYYNAAKAALSGFTQSLLLDDELPFRLIDFRPGDFNTAFMENAEIPAEPTAEASGTFPLGASDEALPPAASRRLQHLHARHRKAPSPEQAAACLVRAMRRRHQGTLRCGTFFQSRLAPLGARLLPERTLRRLIRANYHR